MILFRPPIHEIAYKYIRTRQSNSRFIISCCIMSPPSTQQSFRLQVKRIWRDSSFVTLMSFSLFRIPRQNSRLPLLLQLFTYCEAVRHVISVESCKVESWPSNHVWKSGCINSNEIDWTATFTLSSLSTYAANTYGKRWKTQRTFWWITFSVGICCINNAHL